MKTREKRRMREKRDEETKRRVEEETKAGQDVDESQGDDIPSIGMLRATSYAILISYKSDSRPS